jgi:hypothetical protein
MRVLKFKLYVAISLLGLAITLLLNISWKAEKIRNEELIHQPKTLKNLPLKNPYSLLFKEINNIYEVAELKNAELDYLVFEKALIGYYNLKNNLNTEKEILTVIDFSKVSTQKRLWIIDLKNNKLLLNSYVAHGKASGENLAKKFSNEAESHQSSLGFYVTNETYIGSHGLSLRLDGLDVGVNDQARNRAIVMHGATYVSEDFIQQTGRLGRSFGCPAIPIALSEKMIELLKNKTCLFIYGAKNDYQSKFLNTESAFKSLHTI